MKNKILKNSALVLALLIGMAAPSFTYAQSIDTTVINEKWGKPTFAYGGSLNDEQISETAKLLDIQNRDNVNSINVTGDDLVRYLGDGIPNNDSMISSVLVTRMDKGNGVEVTIKTPDNITQIAANQYANAAITAGVTDARILVGAIRPVTGESALTGVFKAFDANGELLDQDRMQVAQEELETTNVIIQDHKDDNAFSADQFNAAIAMIKAELQALKEKQGELATKEDIERIINEALEKYELNHVISREQIDRLIALFEKYQQTGAVLAPEVKEQLGKLTTELDGIFKKAQDSGLLDQIANFFKQIWEAITKLFQ